MEVIAGCCERGFHNAENIRQLQFLVRLLLKNNAADSFRIFIRRRDADRLVVVWLIALVIGRSRCQIVSNEHVNLLGYDVYSYRRFGDVRYLPIQRLCSTGINFQRDATNSFETSVTVYKSTPHFSPEA